MKKLDYPNFLLRFLSIANGSITELETHILIVERLNLITSEASEQLQKKLNTVGRLKYLFFILKAFLLVE